MIFTSSPTRWEQMYALPLSQRMGTPPDEVVQFVTQYNSSVDSSIVPATREVAQDFLDDARAAIDELPAQVRAHLESRLLGVFFMEGLVSSAFTTLIAYANGDLLGAIVVIDARTFARASANEWATWRENTAFAPTPHTQLNVRIARDEDNTRKTALQYELLHEFGHVIASASRFMPNWWKSATAPAPLAADNFLEQSWQTVSADDIQPLPSQDFELRSGISLYITPSLTGEQIPAVYDSLARTAFPTMYAASSPHEDFAESFATYVHTVLLKHPHEVRISQGGASVAVHERFWEQPRAQGKLRFFERLLASAPELLPRLHIHFEVAQLCNQIVDLAGTAFLGLAPFLRLSVESGDLRHIAQTLLGRLSQDENNAFLWMNASTVFYSIGEHGLGEAMQQQGLSLCHLYEIPAFAQPAKCRVLMLMATGDIAENTPLDCLLEFGAVDLKLYYVSEDAPLPAEIPEHDVLFLAMSESDKNHKVLRLLDPLLQHWDKAVINTPGAVPNSERNTASVLFQDVSGLQMPYTYRMSREQLSRAAGESSAIVFEDCAYPVILRPVGSHAGRDLIRADSSADIASYLPTLADDEFYISRFIDYSGADGQFRKFRIVLIDGIPFIGHMAVSSDWMVHYVNAGMYVDPAKRAEEAQFMHDFPAFAARHKVAFDAIHARSGLDYLCIDCAETRAGELLVFEIGNAMVIHDMDPPDLFPYKSEHMLKARAAIEQLLLDRMAQGPNSGKMSNA